MNIKFKNGANDLYSNTFMNIKKIINLMLYRNYTSTRKYIYVIHFKIITKQII